MFYITQLDIHKTVSPAASGRQHVTTTFISLLPLSALQEEITGLKTGLKEFLKQYYPKIEHIPKISYESCFVSPWASSVEKEMDHKDGMMFIGRGLEGK